MGNKVLDSALKNQALRQAWRLWLISTQINNALANIVNNAEDQTRLLASGSGAQTIKPSNK